MSLQLDDKNNLVFSGEVLGNPITEGSMYAGIKRDLGGRWKNKAWHLPPIALNARKLVEYYGEGILDESPEVIIDLVNCEWGFPGFSPEEQRIAEAHPSWATLYEFQKEAVEYIFCNPHGAVLLGLSPGLGKTPVSVIAADLLELERVLVLAPLTLAKQWAGEIATWSGTHRHAHRAMAGLREPEGDVTITNHEIIQELILRDEEGEYFQPEWLSNARKVKAWIQEGPQVENAKGKLEWVRKRIVRCRRDYKEVPWELIIADESIVLKNRKAVKTDVLTELRKASNPMVWELSGAAISKHRTDLFRQLQIMYPKAFPSYWRFAEFFCIVDKEGWGWTIEGDRPDVDPHYYLTDLYFVKSQEEVLPELPTYIIRWVDLEAGPKQRKALDEMFEDWTVELEGEPDERIDAANWLSRSARLQQITSNMGSLPRPSGKGFYPPASIKEDLLVDLMIQEDVEYPMIVWCWFVETAQGMYERISKKFPKLRIGVVTGPMSATAKETTLESYKAGDLDIIILQLGVGKWGHTLTDTRTVFYHDRTMDSDAWLQSLRRVRRIGLKHRPVLIMPWVENSADELIQLNLEGKLPSVAQLTNSDLNELLAGINGDGGLDPRHRQIPEVD